MKHKTQQTITLTYGFIKVSKYLMKGVECKKESSVGRGLCMLSGDCHASLAMTLHKFTNQLW
jgi:hypothetical protein